MAIAIRASVTVSMAAETSGTRRLISRVSRDVVSTSLGMTSVSPGLEQHVVVGQAQLGEGRRQARRRRLGRGRVRPAREAEGSGAAAADSASRWVGRSTPRLIAQV